MNTSFKRLIIDGNNLLHHEPALTRLAGSDFEQARHRLVQQLDELAGILKYDDITVVFDGRGATRKADRPSPNVEVVFSPSNMTADSVIERFVHESPDTATITVVTSDRGERDTVEAAGGATISCSIFLEILSDLRRQVARKIRSIHSMGKGATLGDFLSG